MDAKDLNDVSNLKNFIQRKDPRKNIASQTFWKCEVKRQVVGKVRIEGMGNGLSLIKLANSSDCNWVFERQPWFMGGQFYSLQLWRGTLTKSRKSLFRSFWVCLPRHPLKLWNEPIVRKILKSIEKVYKVDANSEEMSKGLFTRVGIGIDISNYIKMEIKYIRNGILFN